MKFKIVNGTSYPTRQLRAFVVRGYRVAREAVGPVRAASLESRVQSVRVTFARRNAFHGMTSGHAYLGTGPVHISIPDQVDKCDLAYVCAHEFGHVFGLQHSGMSGGVLMPGNTARFNGRVAELYAWANKLPLTVKPAKPKTPADLVAAKKRAALVARLERWESKRKRAESAIKRLRINLATFDRYQARKAATVQDETRAAA